MIYYIVGIDKSNLNEWVISTHDSAERATYYLENYRATTTDENTMFRIDTVPSNEEIRAANALIPADPNKDFKAKLNNQLGKFGQAKMDHEEGYPYEDSGTIHRSEDFKLTELFLPQPDGFTSDYCSECGVRVEGRNQRTHTAWHNKLLP